MIGIKCCKDCPKEEKEKYKPKNCHDLCVKYNAEVLYNLKTKENMENVQQKEDILNKRRFVRSNIYGKS